MTNYKNLGKDSSVETYEIGKNCIKVKFKNTAKIYSYDSQKYGEVKVKAMITLAQNGEGLGAFINTYLK